MCHRDATGVEDRGIQGRRQQMDPMLKMADRTIETSPAEEKQLALRYLLDAWEEAAYEGVDRDRLATAAHLAALSGTHHHLWRGTGGRDVRAPAGPSTGPESSRWRRAGNRFQNSVSISRANPKAAISTPVQRLILSSTDSATRLEPCRDDEAQEQPPHYAPSGDARHHSRRAKRRDSPSLSTAFMVPKMAMNPKKTPGLVSVRMNVVNILPAT